MAGTRAFGPAATVSFVLGSVAMACAGNQVLPPAAQPANQVSAESVTEIAMERRCSGCDREIEIVLKRDGTAAKTQFGNARRGTVDRQFVSSITVSAFDDLAKMIASDRFFDLLDEYRDPATADGEWIKTTVTAGPRRKSVVSRDGKAPAGLRALEARIDEMANALSWRERR